LSGEIDYATLFGATVRLAASGAPVKVVHVLSNKPLFYLVAQPQIGSIAELRGQPVGVGPRGGSLEHVARDLFSHYGLDPDADLVTRPFTEISGSVPALVAGQLQGAVVPLPFNLTAERQGMRTLVDAADLFRVASGGISTTERRLQEQPEEVRAMLRATLRGVEYARANRAPAIAEIALRSDDPDDLTLREARLLGSADVICHAQGLPAAILARARADAERRPLDDGRPAAGSIVVLRRGR